MDRGDGKENDANSGSSVRDGFDGDDVKRCGAERGSAGQGRRDLHARERLHRSGWSSSAALGSTTRAEAIAVRGDRILAVGTRDEIAKVKGPQTKIVDLGGHFVMPGFNDAHMHMASAGLEKLNVDMVGAKTLDEFRDRLRAKVEAAPPGEWVVGDGLGRNALAGEDYADAVGPG